MFVSAIRRFSVNRGVFGEGTGVSTRKKDQSIAKSREKEQYILFKLLSCLLCRIIQNPDHSFPPEKHMKTTR